MDPLSISTPVVSFLDGGIGIRLKASIDKVNTNRRRLRELTDDLVLALTSVKNFCQQHEVPLRGAPFAELTRSMNQVTQTLLQLCDQADRMAGIHKRIKFVRLGATIAAWRDARNLEARLIRLREKIQISLNHAQLLISARTEVVLTTLEQEVLVSRADDQAHISQLDDLFCEFLCAPDFKYSTVSFLHVSELDHITLPYIRLKLRNIHQVWARRSRTLIIAPGTLSATWPDTYSQLFHSPRHALQFTTVIKGLTEIWQVISIVNFSSVSPLDAIGIIELVDELRFYGLTDITFEVYNCLIRDLLHTIRSSSRSQQIADELRLWLSFTLQRQYLTLMSTPNFSPAACVFPQEALETFLTLSPNTPLGNATSAQSWKLSNLLGHCAMVYYRIQDYDGALNYAQKALETIHPNYQPGNSIQTIPSSLARWTIQDASVAQSCAFLLCINAFFVSTTGDYTRANRFGMDAVSLIREMIDHASSLPSDFDTCDALRINLERSLPSWVSIVHNPSPPAFMDTSAGVPPAVIEEVLSDEEEYVEWGIAV